MLDLNNLVKKPILFEDATMYYNKWVSGIAGREFGTQRVKFKDIVNKNEEHLDQNPNMVKADPVMPFPLPNAVAALGELAIGMSNSIGLFRTALKHPDVQKSKSSRAEVITIINALKASQEHLNNLFITLQKNAIKQNHKEEEQVEK